MEDIQHQRTLDRLFEAFFTPPRYRANSAEQRIIAQGFSQSIPAQNQTLRVVTWGNQGPAILLMHGWGGSLAQMTALVPPLLQAGYRVISYDQPAHGTSPGKTANILEIAPTMTAVATLTGPFTAILAHSFGALVTSYTLAHALMAPPQRVLYFGAFNRLMDSIDRFGKIAKLTDEMTAQLRELTYARFGHEVLEAIVNASLVQQLTFPALLVHDLDDPVTPITDSQAIASAWPSSQLVETHGLGHLGTLDDPETLQRALTFLGS
jgi:pimeloyl-ACP methyl ester carboxylesterase